MNLFLILTVVWFFSHLIVSILRFIIIKDKPKIKDFILIDLIVTYLILWVCMGVAYLILNLIL